MVGRPLTAGERAAVDQRVSALHDGDRRWPYNERVQADPRMEQLLLDALRGPWETLRPGSVWLVWPATATAKECPPEGDISAIASATFPRYSVPCERCGSMSPTRGVVMGAGAVLVGVVVCAVCALNLDLDHGPVRYIDPGRGER